MAYLVQVGPQGGTKSGQIAGSRHGRLPGAALSTAAATASLSCLIRSGRDFPAKQISKGADFTLEKFS